MVWVFKTSVNNTDDIQSVSSLLKEIINEGKWNFDLNDCDNILRIEKDELQVQKVISEINNAGFFCEELAD